MPSLRRYLVTLATLLPCAVVLFAWAVSAGWRAYGVSAFSTSGRFYNASVVDGSLRFQVGAYPRVSPAFAGVEGRVLAQAMGPAAELPERPAAAFAGAAVGEYTAPLRSPVGHGQRVHWAEMRYAAVRMWALAAWAAATPFLVAVWRRWARSRRAAADNPQRLPSAGSASAP